MQLVAIVMYETECYITYIFYVLILNAMIKLNSIQIAFAAEDGKRLLHLPKKITTRKPN